MIDQNLLTYNYFNWRYIVIFNKKNKINKKNEIKSIILLKLFISNMDSSNSLIKKHLKLLTSRVFGIYKKIE